MRKPLLLLLLWQSCMLMAAAQVALSSEPLSIRSTVTPVRPAAKAPLYWVNIAAGTGEYRGKLTSRGFSLSYNQVHSKHLLFTGRLSKFQEFHGNKRISNWDMGVLQSVYSNGRLGLASLGLGLGINGGRLPSKDDLGRMESFVTIGIPVEAQLMLHCGFAGIGLVGLANINPKDTSWGVMLAMQFGRLR